METKQYKVLIVEDDQPTAKIESIALRRLGFDTDIVTEGDKAIPKMKAWKPDVLVLDLELPGKNGVQILQEMHFDPELRNMIIIANSVHIDSKDELGFSFYGSYVNLRKEEPAMINKVEQVKDKFSDLRYVIAQLLGQKYGSIPLKLSEWLNDKNRTKDVQFDQNDESEEKGSTGFEVI